MKVSQRGQITIPKHLRERFGFPHNVEVEISPTVDGIVVRKKKTAMTTEPVVLINTTRVKSKEEQERIASYFKSTGRPIDPNHPVSKVYGILGKDALGKGVSVDDYIEEIRGR